MAMVMAMAMAPQVMEGTGRTVPVMVETTGPTAFMDAV